LRADLRRVDAAKLDNERFGESVAILTLSRSRPSPRRKSTLLRWINRLIDPDAGEVLLSGRPIANAGAAGLNRLRARMPMVFQRFNLFQNRTALDPELVGEVLTIMTDLAREGMTILVVTHEMSFARRTANSVYFISGGRIAERGSPEHIFRRLARAGDADLRPSNRQAISDMNVRSRFRTGHQAPVSPFPS
jgi:ABC-type polar amino acid transport system ATPase subunit